MKINDTIAKRANLITAMRAVLDTASKEVRALNTEEQSGYDKMDTDVTALTATIQRASILATYEANLAAERDSNFRPEVKATVAGSRNRPVDTEGYKAALNVYARQGLNGIIPEHRNALQVGTNTEGGYLVPTEFETQLVGMMVDQDPLRALSHVITTASDRNIPVETSKGTFDYIAEEAAYGAASDPAFGQVVLSAFKSGGIIKVADELLQDSMFDLQSYLVTNAADRFSTLEETNFANGDGSGKPKGIFNTSTVAGVSLPNLNAGSVSAITADNLVDLYHKLGRKYRQTAVFVMADATAKYLRKIKTGISGDTTYVWQPSLLAGQPDLILGRPVVITGGAPAIASAAKTICFVDLSRFYVCDRLGTTMQRLNELYAANGQVGFRFTRRNDARLVDALACATLTQT